MKAEMRIAFIHYYPNPRDIINNRRAIKKGLSIAAGFGVHLALFPELSECGTRFAEYTELCTVPGVTYPFLEDLRLVAIKYQMDIILGRPSLEVHTGTLHNALSHINYLGEIVAQYHKINVGLKEGWALPGRCGIDTMIRDYKVGLLIGEDCFNESLIRNYEDQGCDWLYMALSGELSPNLRPWNNSEFKCNIPYMGCSSLLDMNINTSCAESGWQLKSGETYKLPIFKPQVVIIDWNIVSAKIVGHMGLNL